MKKYQKELDEWFKKNKWEYWSPLSILARLVEECGEFARLVNHLFGDKPKKSDEKEQELEMEIGDIIYMLICFANSNNIDLDKAIRKSFDKVIKRDKDRYNWEECPKCGGIPIEWRAERNCFRCLDRECHYEWKEWPGVRKHMMKFGTNI